MTDESLLNRLCALCGITTSYDDIWGRPHRVSVRTRRALLEAMGVPAQTDEQLHAALVEREARCWLQTLPPVLVVREGEDVEVPLFVPAADAGESLLWGLTLEHGERREGFVVPAELPVLEEREVAGIRRLRCTFTLPQPLPTGYHRLEVEGTPMSVIVVPPTCYQPAAVREEGRVWGLSLQLYALRSGRNWGIGDFGDLAAAVEIAAAHGADVVGVSPLHALPAGEESPYSPSSRLFLNTLLLDVEAVADYAESEAVREAVQNPEFQARLRALRGSELVDYDKVAAAKADILALLYLHFRERHLVHGSPRAEAFRAFQAAGGTALRALALFEVLQRHFLSQDPPAYDWRTWPKAYRNPESQAVREFEDANLAEVEYYEYLQWLAEEQLRAAGRRALSLSLGVGLYQDLAVGASRSGAEAWADQALYALDASIGSPPDDFNLHGQNWELPPLIPERMIGAAYAPFIATLRANMRHGGALRIDHVMGLMRLFWVTSGGTAKDGAYVSYPMADLLGILALESQRNRCLVIGEDLGTVPDAVREALAPLGVLSCRLFWFEKEADGAFRPPAGYPAQVLAAVTNHDLPTLSGFWAGTDLDTRAELGLFPSDEIRQEQAVARAQDRARLLVALEREGLLPPGVGVQPVALPEMTPELARAVHVYLARTPARVLMVQPEDIFGQREQANLPGTTSEHYPSWRRKLPLNLEEWAADARFRLLAEALNVERRPAAAPGPRPAEVVWLPRIPAATYRLQFNRDFTLRQATDLVPYFDDLGISHCYASPLLRARPGSLHGYDIVDHASLNPEIGSREDFDRFVAALRERDMGLILDVVPNHMAVMGCDNDRWLDVLENGPASPYAGWFDIDWNPRGHNPGRRVLVPVLGDHYGAVLEGGGMRLAFDAAKGEFSLWHGGHRFPVDPREYPRILGQGFERLSARMGAENLELLEFQTLVTAFGHLPGRDETLPEAVAERGRDKEILKRYLAALCARSQDIAWLVAEVVEEINGRSGEPRSFDALDQLIEAQAYRPAYWRVAADEINYRRFFDINDLAGLRQEDPEVFQATHGLLGELLAAGQVDGLRIDHPDGLQDPAGYLRRLQSLYGAAQPAVAEPLESGAKPLYVVVEKILTGGEHLPVDWPVYGTTGYEFANLVNGLFVAPNGQRGLSRLYADFTDEKADFGELAHEAKWLITGVALSSELNVLAHQLGRIAQADRRTRDYTINSLRIALRQVAACFPVYRTYITAAGASPEDQRCVRRAVDAAKVRSRAADVSVFDFVHDAILGTLAQGRDEAFRQAVVAFATKFQQFTAPVMAKGMEDTAFYRYHLLDSLNDVGGDPRHFATGLETFHRDNRTRARHWPHAMLNTGTHDSKRSEDVRARINVLSELPGEWRVRLHRWARLNAGHKREVEGALAPDRNDEYLLYQTLIGAWPQGDLDEAELAAFRERIEAYMLKAVRESKRRSSWLTPNAAYEEALQSYIRALLDLRQGRHFLENFLPFQRQVARWGMYNSLSQLLLKLTAPGVPDLYQGAELWEFRLVDPDNRAPVDFARRQALLTELAQAPPSPDLTRALLETMEDSRIKLYLTRHALSLRRARQDLFRAGDYEPLRSGGQYAEHLCAFARHLGDDMAVTVAPRLFASLGVDPPLGEAWADTWVEVPVAGRWVNVFTGEPVTAENGDDAPAIAAAVLLRNFPWGLLVPEDATRADG